MSSATTPSEREQRKVVRWMPYDKTEGMTEAIGGLGGFFNGFGSGGGMRWKDFIGDGAPPWLNYAEALRAEILRLQLRTSGEYHQAADDGVPVFDDETVGTFSYRAWGDLMAAVWSEEDGIDYTYMDFYMDPVKTKEQALAAREHTAKWTGAADRPDRN